MPKECFCSQSLSYRIIMILQLWRSCLCTNTANLLYTVAFGGPDAYWPSIFYLLGLKAFSSNVGLVDARDGWDWDDLIRQTIS